MTPPNEGPKVHVNYRLFAAFTVRGFHPAGDEEITLIDRPPLRAILVRNPDSYLEQPDRSNAVANLMLRGLLGGKVPSGTPEERIAAFVEEARVERRKRQGDVPYLAISVEGEKDVPEPKAQREEDGFIVWIDGGDRAGIMQAHDAAITAVVNGLILYDDAIAGIAKVAESVVYIRSDGKPIYSRTLSMGGATAYVSRPVPAEAPNEIQSLFDSVLGSDDLSSVLNMLRRSFELESEDRFQAFLASWLALEIFVGKTFGRYEEAMLADGRGDPASKAARRYWNRIKEVMKDKYRFADRFAAIAFQLDPDQADGDLAAASQIKDLRDGIVHRGDRVEPRDLPLEATRRLARKYVLLHLAASRPR
jgi:hypothetical protein